MAASGSDNNHDLPGEQVRAPLLLAPLKTSGILKPMVATQRRSTTIVARQRRPVQHQVQRIEVVGMGWQEGLLPLRRSVAP